jgi:hypothetical protein
MKQLGKTGMMKVIIQVLLILIAAITSLSGRAQNNNSLLQHRTHIFHFAPVVGRNISHLTLDSTQSTDGSLAGVAFTYRHKKKHFSTSISAIYSSRGAQWSMVEPGQYGETYEWDFYEQLRYIEMPLKFTWIFFGDSSSVFRPKVSLGPSFGLLVNARRHSEYEIPEWQTSSEPIITDVKDHYKPFDVGVVGSIGFNWEVRQRRWVTLEAGYTYGLLDINKNPAVTEAVMNRDLFILAGVEFPIIRQRLKK